MILNLIFIPFLRAYPTPPHDTQDRTAILIAHRWSSIQIADRVAVLSSDADGGGGSRVIEVVVWCVCLW